MHKTHNVLGLNVAVTSVDEAAEYVKKKAVTGGRGYVCAANVHMCMEAHDDSAFRKVVNGATLIVPDGKPILWWMRSFGCREARQVRGPDLFLAVCHLASNNNLPVALYGGAPEVLARLVEYLAVHYPKLKVVIAISPPFRKLHRHETMEHINEINNSGAKVVFVGLGCPKQEKWMADNVDLIDPIMIGVGAAFDFCAGTKKVAPEWMRMLALEWLHRLMSEPRRLWQRYLWNNPRFLFYFASNWIRHRVG